ncbi:MAG: peptidase inhibitor I78 [Alphaproteobacteria bacterium]|nr:peptidase inhibitor I78 [Alphaproteobacteria bacterium]
MRRLIAICAAGLFMTACQTMPVEPETPAAREYPVIDNTGEAHVCAAEQYQVLVGQRVDDIHTESLPSPRRVYAQGDMVTMDYRPDRLNIVTDARGVVIEVRCG